MTGYPAVQFFEKATVGGLVKGYIQPALVGQSRWVEIKPLVTVPWQKEMEPNFSA
jgi:hypothetical protein